MWEVILQCLAVLFGMAAFMPFIPSTVWWIRGFDFPRFQFTTAAVVVAVLLALLGVDSVFPDGVILAFLLISIGFQAYRIVPYTKLAPLQVLSSDRGHDLSLFVVNVLMDNREADTLIALIREKRPDVVLALETDLWWVKRFRVLADEYPHVVEIPQDDTYGMTLRSRFPLENAVVQRMLRSNIPSIHAQLRLKNGAKVWFYAVHPKPPFPDEAPDTVKRDAELLLVGRKVAEHAGPAIVAGDLNDVAWSKTTLLFQKISRLLDPRIGRGSFNTYHASHRWLRWPLDHVFVSDHFKLRRLALQPFVGSDHFPILVDLSFEPEDRDEQEAPEDERSDHAEARRRISRARK